MDPTSIIVAAIGMAGTVTAAYLSKSKRRERQKRLPAPSTNASDACSDPKPSAAAPAFDHDLNFKAVIESRSFEEQAKIKAQVISAMDGHTFPTACTNGFEACYQELIDNAVEHGRPPGLPPNESSTIYIHVAVNKFAVRLEVRTPEGPPFDVDEIVNASLQRLRENPRLPRGRGLLFVRDAVDIFESTSDEHGVRIGILRNNVRYEISEREGGRIVILHVYSGDDNPSFRKRLMDAAGAYPTSHVILDLMVLFGRSPDVNPNPKPTKDDHVVIKRLHASFDVDARPRRISPHTRLALEMVDNRELHGNRVVVVAPRGVNLLLPMTVRATSIAEALAMISRAKKIECDLG